MISEWAYYKQHFTPEQCDKIIFEAFKIPSQNGTLGPQSIRTNNDWRRSTVRGIVRSPLWSWLFLEVEKLVSAANSQWFNVDYSYLPEIQFATYDAETQGCYKFHKDTHIVSPLPTHRKLSFTIQLSDPSDYEGGELKFIDVASHPKEENLRLRGTVCVFPSIIYHEVTPVTLGTRHSLAGWFEGPRWR
jgi:PKHD-type hydroxylase